MEDQSKLKIYLRWLARILGSLVLLFLLYFVLGHLLSKEDNLTGFTSTEELLTFICFPVLTIIGLLLAYKWEGAGGLVVLMGMVGLILLRSDILLSPFMLALFVPGLLYLASWYLHRKPIK